MLIYGTGYGEAKPQDYKSYKSHKFEKAKQKVLGVLNGISDTSLKPNDKEKLIAQIKQLVSDFK